MYTVRRHLGRGEHYGWFQIRKRITDAKQGEVVEYVNPETHMIRFKGVTLHNKVNQSQKILDGEHKKPCAWLICMEYDVMEVLEPREVPRFKGIYPNELRFNPRESAYWKHCDQIADDMEFISVITIGTQLYTF